VIDLRSERVQQRDRARPGVRSRGPRRDPPPGGSRRPGHMVSRRSGSRPPRGTPVSSVTSASMTAWARTRTPSRRKSASPSAIALRTVSSTAILSCAVRSPRSGAVWRRPAGPRRRHRDQQVCAPGIPRSGAREAALWGHRAGSAGPGRSARGRNRQSSPPSKHRACVASPLGQGSNGWETREVGPAGVAPQSNRPHRPRHSRSSRCRRACDRASPASLAAPPTGGASHEALHRLRRYDEPAG
jgi:hypothetical protein